MEKKNKVLVLGVDGMDPRITKKFLEMGVMPNLKKIVDRGAQREDLVLLGSVPTVTPPMWTTLATGALPCTHGITDYWVQDPDELDQFIFALNSEMCKSELLWNVTAENGLKTLVWHWPGSSWPPSSDSENLHVVGGTNPGSINQDIARTEFEKMFLGSEAYEEIGFDGHVGTKNGAGCIMNEMDHLVGKKRSTVFDDIVEDSDAKRDDKLLMDESESEIEQLINVLPDMYRVPIKPAEKWDNAPEGAKEATILFSDGLIRRLALITKNEQGIYDTLSLYKSRKDVEPLFTIKVGEYIENYIDESIKWDGNRYEANRSVKLVDMAEDGSNFNLWVSMALNIHQDKQFHPKELYQQLLDNVGPVLPTSLIASINPKMFKDVVMTSWDHYVDWAAEALDYMITANDYDVVFSHIHNLDGVAHQFYFFIKPQEYWEYEPGTEKIYEGFLQYMYEMTDRYFGKFTHLLDEGWTIMIVSDHGLMVEENKPPVLGEMMGINIPVMEELGYTVMKKDEDGNNLREIDWEKTKAVASRAYHIYINLKGRDKHGVVDPADKYDLERQIIDDLYSYRDHRTGKRIVSVALRNKDAAVLNMNGPESGDIVYAIDEEFNRVHADSLPTAYGYADTSVSPIFIAAGDGIKEGVKTKRIIRIADVAPTIATLMGVRMPADCEGAPIYQILKDN
ncbi:MAG: alkaline phosphatase family protein [Peptococcaceae bacterium]|nr:alkaline phosphatase family protein [Peptococcaceae bacterium]